MTMEPDRRRPTVHDVARAAGTSHATVSRYLNGHSNVAPGTAVAIEEAIARVRYVPNRTARSLRQQATLSVAFVVREHVDLFYADVTLSRMAAGANAALSQAGYQMMLMLVDSERSEARVGPMIAGGAFDGAILVAMAVGDPLVAMLAGTTIPLVTASSPDPSGLVVSVDTNNTEASRQITQLLLEAGRRRPAEVRGPAAAPVSQLRHEGFVQAVGSAPGIIGPPAVVDAREWSASAGAAAMRMLLRQDPDIDAVVVASDLLAVGAIQELNVQGRSVPEDVAVVGFDDSPLAALAHPPLTTVRQDSRRTGELMARLLMRQIQGEEMPGTHLVTPARVVWRESAGPHPRPSEL
jgi:DNA-binding LacI/PurR family transcriptional regulator